MKETRFKDTEIGRIPVDWDVKRLEEVCEFRNGYTPSKAVLSYWNNGTIPWFRMEDIRKNGHILNDSILHITPQAIKRGLFPKNSIIISTTATIGEHAWIIADSLANQRFTNLIIRKSLDNELDIRFFYWYCYILGEWCRNNINQGGLAAVNMPSFYNLLIPIPTNEEQLRIASALTSIDNLIASLDKLIEKKKNIKQGAMQQLLTGKKRLKGFTEPWVERTLNDIGYIGSGGTPSTFISSYWGGDVNWLQSGAIHNCVISEKDVKLFITKEGLANSAAYLMPAGSVLIAITGATCANIGFLNFESSANQSVVGVTCNADNHGEFLYQKLLTERKKILSFKGGSAQSGVTLSSLRKLRIVVPNSRQEQIAIASVLTSMDNEISALESKKAKYESIKQGMMQQLLIGKIRLI